MHTKPDPVDPEVLKAMGYDRRDLVMKPITQWTTYITVGCIACFFISLLFYNFFSTQGTFWERLMGKKREYSASSSLRFKSPTPKLQDGFTTQIDIEKLRTDEKTKLESYGWTNKQAGKVRLPIEEAIKLAAEGAAPTSNQQVPAVVTGTTIQQNAQPPTP